MSLLRAAALAGALAVLATLSSPAQAEEVKVMQGAYLSLWGSESAANPGSPLERLDPGPGWGLFPYSYSNYSLRFQATAVSGQILASVQGGPQAPFALSVDQAWVKASFGEGWGLAFGRRELKWKDGGYWHPSDVVNNYLAWGAAGQAQGKDSVELTGLLPFNDFNLDLSAATALAGGVSGPQSLPYYLQVGSILYPLEIKAKAALQEGYSPLVGASASYSLEGGNLYADALWIHDRPIEAEFDQGSPGSGSWFRYCAGAQYNFDITQSRLANGLFAQVEYLRQDDGLDRDTMRGYFDYLAAMPIGLDAEKANYSAAAGLWNGRFFSLGRDYLYCDVSISEIADEHIGLSGLCVLNLDDLSFALQSSLSWSPRNLFSISLTATYLGGRAGGEAAMVPYSAQYVLSLSRSF